MSKEEVEALVDLLTWLVLDWRTGVVIALLVVAAVIDSRTRRIPNWLVLSGAIYALAYNSVFPPFPQATVVFPLLGLFTGLALFLPLYLLRAMGAGDVKLLAMVGAFIGPADTLYAALSTMIVGGVFALVFVVLKGRLTLLFQNLAAALQISFFSFASGIRPDLQVAAGASAGRMPYGAAIACGTIGYLVLRQIGLL